MQQEDELKTTPLEIKHNGAIALGDIIDTDEYRQANIYMPTNDGAAFFALFPLDMSSFEILEAMRPLVEGEPLKADMELTDKVKSCIYAGTIERPNFTSALLNAIEEQEQKSQLQN